MVISLDLYFIVLALLALERGLEMVLSWRHAQRALAQGAVETGQRHYRVMVAFHTLFLIACGAEPLLFSRLPWGIVSAVALLGAAAAQGLRYWAVSTLGERWSTRILVLPGSAPITTGPYRYLRHPNYLAVVVEIACVPLIRGCWLTALLFSFGNAVLLAIRIPAEERALGAAYATALTGRARLLPIAIVRAKSLPTHG